MSDGSSGASGMLGVLVGAIIVLCVGAAVLMATGVIGGGSKGPSLTVQVPNAK